MSNVLDDERQQQIRALGRLCWTLSRIQEATGVRRETIGGYLKAAGIAVRSRGRSNESKPKPAISVKVSTDCGPSGHQGGGVPVPHPGRAPSASACELVPRADHDALRRGRNAMRIGPSVSTICNHIHRHEGDASVRRILGVLARRQEARARRHQRCRHGRARSRRADLSLPPPLTLSRNLIDRTGDPQRIVELDRAPA